MRRAKQPIRPPAEEDQEQQMDETSRQSSSRSRLRASLSAHSVAADQERQRDRHHREDERLQDAPMQMHELHASHQSLAEFAATSAAAEASYVPSLAPCTCDEYRSLRCNDKLYSMLHNQIELDPGSVRSQALAQAAAKAESNKLRELFGADLPPEPFDPEHETRAAQSRYHASDFTLGNLKNQSTRVVLPPTIIYSRERPTEYYFTSMQTGQLLRKSRGKVTSQRILEDLLAFGKRNISEALKNLGSSNSSGGGGKGAPKKQERAWEMEKDEYTREVQYGNGADANLPHYMHARAPMVDGRPLKIEQPRRAYVRPPEAFAATGGAIRVQHPLTSSPSSQPQLHCDIVAQFTFASDALRYNDPRLPYTMLVPGADIDTHAFPDILYLNVRSLHHFLTVVNADVARPRALGVLQPFVRCAEERNTVYRVSFTALDATDSAFHAPAADPLASLSSLPTAFHVSMEARQNVVKLVDRSGVDPAAARAAMRRGRGGTGHEYLEQQQEQAARAKRGHEFTAAERAATFDAAHLSMTVDGARSRRDLHADQSNKQHILYPRLPSSLVTPLSPAAAAPLQQPHSSGTILIVPSSYPFSPSPLTSAHRLVVPPALQARFQAAILRMVSHINELYRVSEQRDQEQRERQIEILKKRAHESAGRFHHQTADPSPPLLPRSPSITVGYMETMWKIDRENNLFLLTCRSLKHLVREPQQQQVHEQAMGHQQQPATFVRCAQCCRVCERLPDVLAVKDASVRPTSESILAAERAAASAASSAAASSLAHPSSDLPFYSRARRSGDYDEDEGAARKRRLDRLQDPTRRADGVKSVLVLAMRRKRRGGGGDDDDDADVEQQQNDPDLWPESHFSPPPVPTDRFHAQSDRIQSNPLFERREIRDEEDDGEDDDDGRDEEESREEEPAERSKRISSEQLVNDRLRAANMLRHDAELARAPPPPVQTQGQKQEAGHTPASSASAHSLRGAVSLQRAKPSRPESASDAAKMERARAKLAPYLTADPSRVVRDAIATAVAGKAKPKARPASARPASRAHGTSGHSSTIASAANSSTSSRRSLAESSSAAAVAHYRPPMTAAEKLALLQSSLSDQDIARIMRGDAIRSDEKDDVASPSSHRVDHLQSADVRFYNVNGLLTSKMSELYPRVKAVSPASSRRVDGWTADRPPRPSGRDAHSYDAADTSIEIEENQ